MNNTYKPSKLLTPAENSELKLLSSLLYVAPLSDAKYSKYVSLCKKAHRKFHSNGYCW